jgi:hypothetical protein
MDGEDPAQPFLDDIAVADQTWQEHLQHLRDFQNQED